MQVEHLDNHTARLTVEVPQGRFTAAMQRAAKRISTKVNIPGFRKGKAPFAVVVNYVGQQAVMDEALEELGNEIYRESLQAAALKPYAIGNLEEVRTEPTLQFVFSVPKAPEVDLGDYRQVRHEYNLPVVTDEQVQEELESLRERHAEISVVDRPAELGDVITVDIRGEDIHSHAQPKPDAAPETAPEQATKSTETPHSETFINETDFDILLTNDPKREFMPGFTEKVLGVSAGETRTVTLAYSSDYENRRLAGHTFNITLTVKSVKARKLPELNDDFAKLASNNKVETLDNLVQRLRADLEAEAKYETDDAYSEVIFQKIMEGATVRYPEAMVEDYIDTILDEVRENLQQRGLSLETLKKAQGKDDAALRADYRETAIRRIKRDLVLQALLNAEQVRVSDAELDAHIESMFNSIGGVDAAQAETFRRMFKSEANRRDVAFRLLVNRLKERLVAIGRGIAPDLGAPEDLTMPVAEQQIVLPSSDALTSSLSESSEQHAASERPETDAGAWSDT